MMLAATRAPRLKWGFLIIIAWLAVLSRDQLALALDQIWPRPPWVSATIEILPPDIEGAAPVIMYRAQAHRQLRSTIWTAVIYDENGRRLATRKGRGDYRRSVPPAREWDWTGFFTGFVPAPPVVPAGPFRICVNYNSIAVSGAQRHGDDFCSDLYNPKGMDQ